MKKGQVRGHSFLHRWLSRSSRENAGQDDFSDAESEVSTGGLSSPPPLTDGGSTVDPSVLATPKSTSRQGHSNHPPPKNSKPTPAPPILPFPKSRLEDEGPNDSQITVLHSSSNTRGAGPSGTRRPVQSNRTDVGLNSSGRDGGSRLAPTAQNSLQVSFGQSIQRPASRVKTPWTPPSRVVPLPDSPSLHGFHRPRPSISLPSNAQRPVISSALVTVPSLTLNPILLHDSNRRPIRFNVVLPPHSVRKYPPPAPKSSNAIQRRPPAGVRSNPPIASTLIMKELIEAELSQLATTPPIKRMRIVTDQVAWSIDVFPRQGSGYRSPFLTVGDVLGSIYEGLRRYVSNEEWKEAPSRFREQVKKARIRRLDAFKPYKIQAIQDTRQEPLRLVDYLLDVTMFAGLEQSDEVKTDDLCRNDGITTFFMKLEPQSDY